MGLTTVKDSESLNFKVSYIDDGDYMIIEVSGEATLSVLKSLPDFVIQHPDWYEAVPALVDFRGCSTASLSSEDIFELAELIKSMDQFLGSGRCAIITSREIDFGLARMWQMMTEDHVKMDIEVFKSIDEAKEWMMTNREG